MSDKRTIEEWADAIRYDWEAEGETTVLRAYREQVIAETKAACRAAVSRRCIRMTWADGEQYAMVDETGAHHAIDEAEVLEEAT